MAKESKKKKRRHCHPSFTEILSCREASGLIPKHPPRGREGNAGTGAEVGMSDRHINSKPYQITDLTTTQAGFLYKTSTH